MNTCDLIGKDDGLGVPHFQTNQHILVDTGGDVWKQDQGSRKSRGGGVGVRLDNSADSNSLSPIDPIWLPSRKPGKSPASS